MCWASQELPAQSNSVSTLDQVTFHFMTSYLGKAGVLAIVMKSKFSMNISVNRRGEYFIQSSLRLGKL